MVHQHHRDVVEVCSRHYWELAALFAVRGALRSGEIWVEGSRRYGDVASYLIRPEEWPAIREEVRELCGLASSFSERLTRMDADYERDLDELEALLAERDGPVHLDAGGELHLRPLSGEVVEPEVRAAKDAILARLPMVPLAEAIIEVDRVTRFSDRLTHAGGGTPRVPELEHRRNLYAALLAQACNFKRLADGQLANVRFADADVVAAADAVELEAEGLGSAPPAPRAGRAPRPSPRGGTMTDYHINMFWSDEDEAWVADIPDLHHCSAVGATPQEALAEVLEAKQAWIESASQHGDPMPEPRTGRRSTRRGNRRRRRLSAVSSQILCHFCLFSPETRSRIVEHLVASKADQWSPRAPEHRFAGASPAGFKLPIRVS
ncbi:MAG TPA: hypothetical protein VK988_03810 [Acidimicrobiales bacterium]|nr:hypothetical protein [Acidimicrobiales bacterium]